MSDIAVAPAGAVTVRTTFDGQETTAGHEVAAVAVASAAAAKAEIEARIVAAWKRPRDLDLFRAKIVKYCGHPSFARIALYSKPVGKKKNETTGVMEQQFATNFSVRFIETALQFFGNAHITARITHDDTERVLLSVGVTDVENNLGYSLDSMIDKRVERKFVKKGQVVHGQRENSWGDMISIVDASPDEVVTKVAAQRSKLIRDNGMRLLPRDILDDARAQIDKTLADELAKDPDAEKKKLLDAFMKYNVTPVMLREYIEVPIEQLAEKQLAELRVLYAGLREGEFTWPDMMRMKSEQAEEGVAPAASTGTLKEKVLAARDAKTAAKQPAAEQPAAKPEMP